MAALCEIKCDVITATCDLSVCSARAWRRWASCRYSSPRNELTDLTRESSVGDIKATTLNAVIGAENLRNAPTLSVFKSSLKTFLFRKAYQ
nr:hypothetical protein BaRGS_003126 [Batillaria attramentaria]